MEEAINKTNIDPAVVSNIKEGFKRAITPEQREAAFAAARSCPFSTNKLTQLCELIADLPFEKTQSFETTLSFVRRNRLPKAKTGYWLNRNDIHNDGDLWLKLWMPMLTAVTDEKVIIIDGEHDDGTALD